MYLNMYSSFFICIFEYGVFVVRIQSGYLSNICVCVCILCGAYLLICLKYIYVRQYGSIHVCFIVYLFLNIRQCLLAYNIYVYLIYDILVFINIDNISIYIYMSVKTSIYHLCKYVILRKLLRLCNLKVMSTGLYIHIYIYIHVIEILPFMYIFIFI